MPKPLSASGIKKFRDCPKQWWFRYRAAVEGTKTESEYAVLGSTVHEAIENVLREGEPYGPAAFMQEFRDLAADTDLPPDFVEDGADYAWNAGEFLNGRDYTIRGIEEREEFQIERPDVDEPVTAILDVTTEGQIWDWKTGRIRDDTPMEEKIQAGVYAAAYFNLYGEWPEVIRFVYLQEEEVRKYGPDDDLAALVLKYARQLVRAKREQHFPADPGDQCYWCEWEYYCEESGVGVGENFDWEDYTSIP